MTGPLVAIAVVLAAAAAIALAAREIMDRIGVSPDDPGQRSAGFGDVLERLRQWLERRRPPE